MQQLFNLAQVAEQLGVSVSSVRRYIRDGDLPAVSLGYRTLRVSAEALDEFVALRSAATP